MRKILPVPFYSQHIDVKDSEWQERACGIAALKMVIDFLGAKTPTLDELIRRSVSLGAYGPSGWIHAGLVSIASQFGVEMKREEFRSSNTVEVQELLKKGINELVISLEEGKPILVSGIKKWIETKKFHMMVLIGFEMDEGVLKGFYYHDPDAFTTTEGKDQFVTIETFKKHWRRMAIFSRF